MWSWDFLEVTAEGEVNTRETCVIKTSHTVFVGCSKQVTVFIKATMRLKSNSDKDG